MYFPSTLGLIRSILNRQVAFLNSWLTCRFLLFHKWNFGNIMFCYLHVHVCMLNILHVTQYQWVMGRGEGKRYWCVSDTLQSPPPPPHHTFLFPLLSPFSPPLSVFANFQFLSLYLPSFLLKYILWCIQDRHQLDQLSHIILKDTLGFYKGDLHVFTIAYSFKVKLKEYT